MFARERSRSPRQSIPHPDAVTFLRDHIIDDAVLTRFLALDQQLQQAVMLQGPLSGASDPSAVLSSRISQVSPGSMGAFGMGVAELGGCGGCGGDMNNPMMQMMMMQMMQMGGGVAASAPAATGHVAYNSAQAPRNGDWYCQQCGDHQFAKNSLCRNCGAARPTDGSESIPPSAEQFVAVHQGLGLEDHVVAKFRALDPDSQLVVIKRGSLNGARDPNAVLLGRIKTVQQRGAGFGQSGGEMGGGFAPTAKGKGKGKGKGGGNIQPSPSDWYCPNCYDLQFRNNDACRICGTSREFGVKDINSFDPNTFLAGHQIDPQAVQQFMNLPDDQKRLVMQGGSLHGARDPTAVLINRMAKARASGIGGQPQLGMGGEMNMGGGMNQLQVGMGGAMNMGSGMDMQMQDMMQQMMLQMMQQQQGVIQ
eukprot:CAMPEP_0169100220 /NCGR_PEP_ID=MMETSP1015-20121227/20970_1 /TAXON_ID=342587 /ORGANISM="Karlodinium micrum, Strain CCMP2283" /LENGTH=420 /DNA_ID=CAMNT_0009161145 /DNA_START=68 /DNA_END=1330 /DNA_ORIENTATION=-